MGYNTGNKGRGRVLPHAASSLNGEPKAEFHRSRMLLSISAALGIISLALFSYRLRLRFRDIPQGKRDAASMLGFTALMASFVHLSPALAGVF